MTIDIDALKQDKRPQSSTLVHALIDRLEAAESDAAHQKALADSALRVAEGWEEKCNTMRADKATLQQMTYSLKDRLEAAEKERDDVAQQLVQSEIGKREISEAHNAVTRRLSVLADENTTLRAKIEAMEKQEPVATVIKEGDSRYWMSERLWAFPDGKYPLYALPGAQAQPAQKAVAYLDLGVGGYVDVGTDLTDEALAALPKGRHMLGIVGTYGVDGYVPAQPAPSVPDGVAEALQRLIENGAVLGPGSAEDALLVARYRQHLLACAPSVPDAWKLVPIEPTPTMITAALESSHVLNAHRAEHCYRAMLAAAPEAKP